MNLAAVGTVGTVLSHPSIPSLNLVQIIFYENLHMTTYKRIPPRLLGPLLVPEIVTCLRGSFPGYSPLLMHRTPSCFP